MFFSLYFKVAKHSTTTCSFVSKKMQDNEDNYTTPPAMSIAGLTSSRPPGSKSTSSAQKQTNLFEMGLVSSSSGAEKNKKQVVVHNPSDAAYILLLQQRDDMKGVPLAPYHEKEKEYGEVSYQLQGLFRPVASGETPNLILMKDLKERKNILEIMVAARKRAIEQCVKLREDARTGMVHTKQSHVEDIESYWLWDKIRDACDQLLSDHDASRELQVQRKRQRKTTPVTIMHPAIAANPCVQEEEPVVHVETADGLLVPLDDVFEAGKKSKLSKKTKLRKYANDNRVRKQTANNARITSLMWKSALASAWKVKVGYRKGVNGEPGIVSGLDKYNHGLSLTGNIVRCAVCCVDNVSWRTLQQHLGTQKHQDRLTTWRANESNHQTDLQLVVAAHVEVNTVGQTLSAETRLFRLESLYTALRSNKSIGQLQIEKRYLEKMSGLSLGEPNDLSRMFGPIIQNMIGNKIREIVRSCYPEFGTTTDGSPSVASAEAIALRLVRKQTLQPFDLLIDLQLYEKSLNSGQLAHGILLAIRDKAQLRVQDWRTAMVDGASTNTAALRKVSERLGPQCQPQRRRCNPHGLSILGSHFNCPDAELARQQWNQVIMHSKFPNHHARPFMMHTTILTHVPTLLQGEQQHPILFLCTEYHLAEAQVQGGG
jgi:hypothetical protein